MVLLAAFLVGRGNVAGAQTAAWQRDRPCQDALRRGSFSILASARVSPTQAGCRAKRCTRLHDRGMVCQCLGDSTRTIDVAGVGPQPLRFVRPWSGVQPDSFEVIQADLDGDGSKELVLATFDAMSNGMGVAYWTVFVLTPARLDWIVDSLPVQEYSSSGSWVVLPKENRCNLLQTAWVNGF